MTSSGLQFKVAYWLAMTLGGTVQVVETHCPNYIVMIVIIFSAQQHICYSALCAIARPSVCPSVCLSVRLSVTRVDQSKTVEIRIMQPLPQSSPMTLVFWCLTSQWNSSRKIGSGGGEWHKGSKNTQFSANKSPLHLTYEGCRTLTFALARLSCFFILYNS